MVAAEPFRFAVYAAPDRESELDRRAQLWLRDAEQLTGIDGLTRVARHYGLHATLKPPFRPAEGVGATHVHRAVAELAARTPPVTIPSLVVGTVRHFVALVPATHVRAVHALEARCVTELDHLRRLPSPAEVERRRAAGLTPLQEALLLRWGYPFLLGEFVFHLTLSCELGEDDRVAVADAARRWFGPLDGAAFTVDALCVFEQSEPDAAFREAARHPMAGP